MIPAHKRASVMGLRVPAAKGAIVNGIRAADIALCNPLVHPEYSLEVVHTFQKPSDNCHG